jgi:two-component system cell cycle sensor histidine kinase/response regulator CckA
VPIDVLKLLHVEDSGSDACLIIRSLEKAGYEVQSRRVEDAAGMRDALANEAWDVVISDYRLPGFDASHALAILKETGWETPFIVVSGTIGEDMAVQMMKAGAHDYVLKNNLSRLAPAVAREIRDARVRQRRRQTDEALRQSEERFRAAFENAPIGMALVACDGRFTAVNDALCEILGYTSEELLAKTFQEITHPTDQESGRNVLPRMLAGEMPRVAFEKRYLRKDGTVAWAHVHFAVLHDAAGVPAGFITQIQDVTERRRAEEALRESEARERTRATELQAVMDAAPVALFLSRDSESREMIGNRQTYELLQLAEGINLSKTSHDSAEPPSYRVLRNGVELAPVEMPMQTAARTGRSIEECEFDLVFADGTSRQMFGKVVPLLDESGKARGAVGGFLDVTARKLAEERLRRTQKLESIGLLAGGVAHDFNNILTVISGNVSLAIHDLCPRCEIRSLLEVAIESAGRAAGLTRQLLAYAGKGAFTRMRVSISEVAQRAVRFLQSSVPKRVELRTELAPNLPPLLMDPYQMEQVLINLILNGTEAIGEHGAGVVTVRTDGANGFLRLLVSDTGAGMDQATQERMFEPFFTTRFTGRGLGLAAVDGIVRSLNGQISVDSAPGQGTRIQIVLPIADTQVVSHGPVAADPTRAAARGAILVVDDEPQIRKMAAAILRKADIDVLEASTGKEAIAILAERGSDVRAVLLDLAMPELTGDQALPALFKLRPDIHVIVSSGYSDAEVKRYFRDHVNVRSFLPKPYGGEQLIAQVMAAIGGAKKMQLN